MPDLTYLAAAGFASLGLLAGFELGWHWAHLLHKPLPRPWANKKTRYFFRRAWRYLAPGTLWRDIGRAYWTGQWTQGDQVPPAR